MTDQAAKREERAAAGIFDDYLAERLRGGQPIVAQFTARCPATERQRLEEAIQGADVFLRDYHLSYVRPDVLEKTRAGIEALKRKKERLSELRGWAETELEERAGRVWDLGLSDPVEQLIRLLNVTGAPGRGEGEADKERRVYNRGGSGLSARNGFHLDRALRRAKEQSIAAKVQETIDQAAVTGAPVDLEAVARRLYLVVRSAAMDDVEGSLVTDGEVGGILINSKITNEQRRRFTLAHEIGHFVLHRDRRTFRDTPQELRDYASSTTEIEANIFAAMLLLPPSMLPPDFGSDKPRLEQADDLARRFGVSLEAALRRIVGQSNWRCALVVSRDGLIKWVVPSPEFDGFIPVDRRPHPATMARLLLDTAGPDEDGISLPAYAWAEGLIAEEGVQVYEQSRRLASGHVYSLVTALDPE